MNIIEVKISEIKIGERFRKDMGDLPALAESIEEMGDLLQPIGITPDKELVFGERRLRAYRDVLGRETIPARIIPVESVLLGQITENTMRKSFTPSEMVGIVDALRSFRHGGDRRSHQARKCGLETMTVDRAARLAGLGGKDTYKRAKDATNKGIPEVVHAMDSGKLSIAAAAEIATLAPDEQHSLFTKKGCTAKDVAKYVKQQDFLRRQEAHRKALAEAPAGHNWKITADQSVVKCQLLLVDPPYGITEEPWEPEDLESFTSEWASRWSSCGADFIAIFFSQQHMWQGRKWFDDSLTGYCFQQLCNWHAPNNLAPKSRKLFKQTWEPVFVYRRIGSERLIHHKDSVWTGDLHDLDCHVASVPQTTYSDDDHKVHPCQKPVSAMRWLVNALSRPGELVVDPFCGSGTTGIAAAQLGRRFHGIEIHEPYRRLAEERIAAFGQVVGPEADACPDERPLPCGHEAKATQAVVERHRHVVAATTTVQLPSPDINTVLQGDCRDLISRLPNASINLCLCSPPYADQRKGHYPGVPEAEYPEFTVEWMGKLWDKLTDDGSVLIIIDPHVEKGVMADYVLRTQLALREAGWKEHQTQIWHKQDRGPLGHKGWPRHAYEQVLWLSKTSRPFCDPKACGKPCRNITAGKMRHSPWSPGGKPEKLGTARVSDVIDVPVGVNEKGIDHPAIFPMEVAERLIATFCPPGGTVVDCFAGSGSTLVAAKRLGRSFYGFDMMPAYCEIARKRLAKTVEGEASLPKAG